MQTILIGHAATGLSERQLATALSAMHEEGIVCLKGALAAETVTALNKKMQSDLDVRTPSRNFNAWNSLRPPPFHPHLYKDLVYNEAAIDICRGLLGPRATLTTYGANTSWPGHAQAQNVHRDVPDGPITDRCPAVVINYPLTDFTIENGATLIYPESHRACVVKAGASRQYSQAMLDQQALARSPEQTIGIGPGDLIVRDLRLWHGGMPNTSDERRIMLALVVIDPDYQQADETGFKGFEAEIGSEDFWHHPRLATSVHFVPAGDRSYYLHGHHSTPPTPLYLDWQSRKGDPKSKLQR